MEAGNELDEEKRMEEANRFYLKGVEISQAADDKTWEKSQAEAAKWYRKAAELGLAEAQYQLGLYHEFRRKSGVRAEAEQWYRKAAEQDYCDGQYNLGLMYKFGHGVRQSDKLAAQWFREAAKAGDECAIRELELMGEEVPD